MAYKIIDRVYNAYTDDYRLTIVADTDEDVLDLPLACVGSTVIVADRGNEYMANSAGGWVFKSGDESRAVKYIIGAKEIAGTWQLNDTLDHSGFDDNLSFTFDFYINNYDGYVGKGIWTYPGFLGWFYSWGDGSSEEGLYDSYWMSGKAPTLTTSATVDSVSNGALLLEWLNANATKIA